jgi:hypothetical protein
MEILKEIKRQILSHVSGFNAKHAMIQRSDGANADKVIGSTGGRRRWMPKQPTLSRCSSTVPTTAS